MRGTLQAVIPRTFTWASTLVLLLTLAISLEVVRARRYGESQAITRVLYVPSGTVLAKMVLSFDALAADVYWIRAIQHYGGTKRSEGRDKRYDLLYPLLDIATSLDPRFSIAYRFGAIFLGEPYPNGPGQPDQAIALLRKGIRAQPTKWEYLQDVGFVYYWRVYDFKAAAGWFHRASQVEGAPWWLRSLAAHTLAQGGDRHASRLLWQQIYSTADNEWLRRDAERRLTQLAALDQIDRLTAIVQAYARQTGSLPASWARLVRDGFVREMPLDPAGTPYALDPATGSVTVSRHSTLFPLPVEPPSLPGS